MESLANKVPNLKVFCPFRSTDPERNPQFTRLLQHTAKAAGQRQPIDHLSDRMVTESSHDFM